MDAHSNGHAHPSLRRLCSGNQVHRSNRGDVKHTHRWDSAPSPGGVLFALSSSTAELSTWGGSFGAIGLSVKYFIAPEIQGLVTEDYGTTPWCGPLRASRLWCYKLAVNITQVIAAP